MAFNKNKALENALKYLNQGRVAQAISEYQQILRHDAKDQATLMTVGDLFARQGDMSHAIEYFERLAQVYLNDGFNSKAIAIYKKIAKLAPAELAPLERLADLYVQQGVLSEARPLFLQIAEAHLKANRAPKAVEVLHRLLEVEPENPRVQMRLAELYNVMGQKKDAAKTYLAYAQRLFDRSETAEAEKLVERALEVDPSDASTLLLKAKILAGANKDSQAISILERHPEADAGGDVTNLVVDLELRAGQIEKAADRARNQLVRGNAHFGLLYRVADALIGSGQVAEALPLLRELRDPMIEVSEHDKFVKSLTKAGEQLPGNAEPLEMLADFCRHTSDPFPLNAALTQLVDIYTSKENYAQAEQILEELVDRNKGDERLAARLDQMRKRSGRPAAPKRLESEMAAEPPLQEAAPLAVPSEPAPVVEEALDPETQRYIAQALTDVDLFSSYGLTHKATQLLENILGRAPRYTPALERLLDIHLGTGDERRTAELAAHLEQIHRQRGDVANADRFAELRQRFQKLTGLTLEELAPAPAAPVLGERSFAQPQIEEASEGAVPVEMAPRFEAATLTEFEIPSGTDEPDPSIEETLQAPIQIPLRPIPSGEEVELSDEWEAMVQEVAEPPAKIPEVTALPYPPIPAGAAPSGMGDQDPPIEFGETFEIQDITEEWAEAEGTPSEASLGEPQATGLGTSEKSEFDLELAPDVRSDSGAATTEEFIDALAAEVEGFEAPAPVVPEAIMPEAVASALSESMAGLSRETGSAVASEPKEEPFNELAEVFQEFRSELGELGEEDEDLETHYNLGIAYREMALLDEAIGEFQKVAKAVEKGKPFRYAMNCVTLLALSFRDKGEPRIASLWYRRALDVPGLEQETILALRYDLGISLEMAGDSSAALDCFRQVYAMNIDYRDVADHIATLQHQ